MRFEIPSLNVFKSGCFKELRCFRISQTFSINRKRSAEMREEYRDKTIVNTNSSEDKSDRILFVNIL